MRLYISTLVVIGWASLLGACSPKSGSDPAASTGTATSQATATASGASTSTASTSSTTTSAGTGSVGSDGLAAVDDVSDLQLSQLNLSLPAALDAKSTSDGLQLTASKKSADACNLGQSVKEVTSRLGSIASFACHIEVEKEKIAIGKKYKIVYGGQEFGRVFVEKTDTGINFAMCGQDGKESISINKITEAGPAGTIHATHDSSSESEDGGMSTDYLLFDLNKEGEKSIIAKQKFANDSNSVYLRYVDMLLSDTGVSLVKLASRGTQQGNSFSQRGTVKFDQTFGAALFHNVGSHDGSEFAHTNRSYFTLDGLTTLASESPEFASGGLLYVTPSDIPEFLSDSEEIPTASGWVASGCEDFDEIVELDPDSAAHQTCNSQHGAHANCYGDDFEYGEATTELDAE